MGSSLIVDWFLKIIRRKLTDSQLNRTSVINRTSSAYIIKNMYLYMHPEGMCADGKKFEHKGA